jgi:hypothetical protein
MTTKTTTSKKHEGYKIEIEVINNRKSYTLYHNEYKNYAVAVYPVKNGGFVAELLTKQQWNGLTSFEPHKRNPVSGTVAEVKAELERRGDYWKTKGF